MSAPGERYSLRRMWAEARWALAVCRSTLPRHYVAFWAASLVGMVCPAGIALSVRGLVNVVSAGLQGDAGFRASGVYLWLGLGLMMTLGMVLAGSLGRYLARRFEAELRHRLRLEILQHASAMSCARLENPAFQDGLRRAREAPEAHVAHALSFSLELLVKFVQGASLMAILVAIEPILFVLLLPIAAPYLAYQWRLSRRQFDELDSRIRKQRWIEYYSGELVRAEQAAEIKLLDLAQLLIDRCRTIMDQYRALLLRHQHLEFVGSMVFAVLTVIATYLAMTHAAFTILDGSLSIGDLAIYGSAATQLRGIVENGIGQIAALRWEVLHVANLHAFLGMAPEATAGGGDRRVDLRGGIEFRDVTFAYPDAAAPVFSDLSFRIEPGETVALVGDNGAGKTTIAKLIARLYDPQAGSVRFDGIDGQELDVLHHRGQVACVFQNFGRYAASAGDNIAFGDWRSLLGQHERVEDIARRAGVHELIAGMPDGYETLLGQLFGEAEPSGGQWQQLAIARAMARNASILILDEPTANLDITTELRIFERFRALAAGRTTVLISHRFSTVRMADRILVLDSGKIVEAGTHEQLIRLDGQYATLYRLHRRHLEQS